MEMLGRLCRRRVIARSVDMNSPRSSFSPVSRRVFLGRLSLGAAALASAPYIRAQGTAPKKLGVALVGLGGYATRELGPALKLTKQCHLTGVVTGSPQKVPQLLKDYGFSEKNVYSYDTLARIADNKDIDIVYIVTPNGLHAQHAIAAAKAGKHVIVEKPMANTAAECDAILAACNAAKVKCSVGYRLHFDPYHKEMKRLAREKDFGAFMKMKGNRGFVVNNWRWRIDRRLAGGGPMMDIGIYINQAACMAAGELPPSFVSAQHIPITKPELFKEVEEGTRYTLEFPNGAVCEAFTSYAHSSDMFRAEGDKGWIEFKEKAFTYRGAKVDTSRGPLEFLPYVNQQALQMDDFAVCVRENRESPVSGAMGRRDNVVIDAIYEAARTGRKVAVKM
jgi:glucose-fructose oxidoreductase